MFLLLLSLSLPRWLYALLNGPVARTLHCGVAPFTLSLMQHGFNCAYSVPLRFAWSVHDAILCVRPPANACWLHFVGMVVMLHNSKICERKLIVFINLPCTSQNWSWDNSVTHASGWTSGIRFPAGVGFSSSLLHYSMGTRDFFPRVKVVGAWTCQLTSIECFVYTLCAPSWRGTKAQGQIYLPDKGKR